MGRISTRFPNIISVDDGEGVGLFARLREKENDYA